MREVVPQLFDPVKHDMAMTRAMRRGFEEFLIRHLTRDLSERLATVKREFSRVLDLGTPLSMFAQAGRGPGLPGSSLASRPAPMTADEKPVGQLDLAALRFEPAQYDLVLSGLYLHAVNDLPGLLIRLRAALRPDGLMLAAFAGGETLRELRDVLLAAESEARGAAGLRVFPMIDVRSAGQLLQRAGFALPVADSEKLTIRYDHIFALIGDLRAMGATATPLIRPGQPGLTRSIIARAGELYAERHADADGRIRASVEIIWISGWAPHESQQKPLKPGSASMRLADALRATRKGDENS